jgi:hypothetical protein
MGKTITSARRRIPLAGGLDIAVGRSGAGHRYAQLVLPDERRVELWHDSLRFLWTQGEADNGVGGVAII